MDNTSTTTIPASSNGSGRLRDRIKSPPSLPLSNSNPRDLAIALDGSFVETTSHSAAKALVKWYSSQDEKEDFAVQTRTEAGKVIYRIRPRSSIDAPSPSTSSSPSLLPASPIIASPIPSSPTSPNPTFTIQNPSPRKPTSPSSPSKSARQWVLKTSRSIPLLRGYKNSLSASPSTRLTFNDSLQLPPSPHSYISTSSPPSPTFNHKKPSQERFHLLRKSGSTPTLSSNVQRLRTKSSLANLNAKNSRGDVLGRLLGWNDDEEGRRSKRREENSLGFGMKLSSDLPREFDRPITVSIEEDKNMSTSHSTPPTSSSLPKRLRSDSLPNSFTSTRPILLNRANSSTTTSSTTLSPFGSGVRIPRRAASEGISSDSVDTEPNRKSMREAASNETIRLPKESAPLPTKKRKRFQDPEIFDIFQNLDSLPLPSSTPTTPNINSQHRRQQSSTSSIASSSNSSTSRSAAHLITVTSTARDDPRFVIWGQKESTRRETLPPLPSSSIHSGSYGSPSFVQSTNGGGSPMTSSSSRRWSLRDSRRPGNLHSSPATSVRESVSSTGDGGKEINTRILMAATVERLVAELTSKIEVELLCGFFLTYRSFVRPVDLLKLLITRFEWAMMNSNSPEDEAGRRIVRVRTFVVLRHWLLNFFIDDFIPDRRLRTTLTEWLNSASKTPSIKESPKDQRLIKGLKKLVRKLKELHLALGPDETAAAAKVLAYRNSTSGLLTVPPIVNAGLGNVGEEGGKDILDDDVDLELEGSPTPKPSISTTPIVHSSKITRTLAPTTLTRPVQSNTTPHLSPPTTHSHTNFSFPNSQNVIARSVTSALGTLSRFKRNLKNRTITPSSGNHFGNRSVEALNELNEKEGFEQNETGDLLWVKGGLAKYLAYHGIEPEEEETKAEEGATVYTFPSLEPPSPVRSPSIAGLGIVGALEDSELDYSSSLSPSSPVTAAQIKSYRSSSFIPRGGYGNRSPLGFQPSSFEEEEELPLQDNVFFLSHHRPRSARIELDDVDLSDEDEDVVEVKRTLKRLPGAHNLRMLKNLGQEPFGRNHPSVESISSYGSPRVPSFSYGSEGVGTRKQESMVDSEEDLSPGGVQVVPNFVLEGIDDSDDDDEPGDVEAALRRLEGIVDDSKEKEKARKVEKQMEKSLRLQLAAATAAAAAIADDSNSPEEAPNSDSTRPSIDAVSSLASSLNSPTSPTFLASNNPREIMVIEEPVSLIPPDRPNQRPQTNPLAQLQPRRMSLKAAIPRKASFSKLLSAVARPLSTRTIVPITSPPPPPSHRSFILQYRTEVLAQQFCLIERDMLRVLGWQELVGGNWRDRHLGSTKGREVLDWEIYLKEKRVEELNARTKGERSISSAVEAIIMRFNLTANWVCSEIVLTAHVDDRATLIGKFIRLAFKCYCQSNFQTLSQIIHGLQSQEIERLSKTWARVPSWEMRKFRNMKLFVSNFKNFKLLREVTHALISEYGPPGQRSFNDSRSTSSKGSKPPPPTGCIPFLGLFLRDLTLNASLPTFLDPTSPTSPAKTDAHGSLLSTFNLSAFNHLLPLPPGTLQPLVNVHKFRLLAKIVGDVLAFQEFSQGYDEAFKVERGVYFRCLKIRCLSEGIIRECSERLD